MSTVIRLTRIGKKSAPKYRIVVTERRSKRDGKYIEKIGFYDPILKENSLLVDEDKLKQWVLNGAQPSAGAARLLKKYLRVKKAQ